MINYIILAVVLCILAGIVLYLLREKKRGGTCVGCPYAKECAKHHGKGSCHTDHG